MLLKNIYDLSDKELVAHWMENPYMQYFRGERIFQKHLPMNSIDMTKFRKWNVAEEMKLRFNGGMPYDLRSRNG